MSFHHVIYANNFVKKISWVFCVIKQIDLFWVISYPRITISAITNFHSSSKGKIIHKWNSNRVNTQNQKLLHKGNNWHENSSWFLSLFIQFFYSRFIMKKIGCNQSAYTHDFDVHNFFVISNEYIMGIILIAFTRKINGTPSAFTLHTKHFSRNKLNDFIFTCVKNQYMKIHYFYCFNDLKALTYSIQLLLCPTTYYP